MSNVNLTHFQSTHLRDITSFTLAPWLPAVKLLPYDFNSTITHNWNANCSVIVQYRACFRMCARWRHLVGACVRYKSHLIRCWQHLGAVCFWQPSGLNLVVAVLRDRCVIVLFLPCVAVYKVERFVLTVLNGYYYYYYYTQQKCLPSVRWDDITSISSLRSYQLPAEQCRL